MPPQQVDYDKLAKEHGGTPVPLVVTPKPGTDLQTIDYEALAREQGGKPRYESSNIKDVYGNAVVDAPLEDSAVVNFLGEATKSVNPRLINEAIQQAFWHPIDTAQGLRSAQDQLRIEAGEAFQKGDTARGIRKTIDWLIPILGPRISEAGDYGEQGDVPRMLGATTDVAVNLFGEKAMPKSLPVLPRVGAKVPGPVAEAVQFGLREGIPVDVATATNNKFLRGTQRIAEESLFGSRIGEAARGAQAEALTATGERLATRTSPLPVTAEEATQAVRSLVTKRAEGFDAAADAAYARLRTLETQAATPTQTGVNAAGQPTMRTMLAVDIAPTKAAMKATYQALQEENALVPFISESKKGRALVMLDRLMKAPDLAPLSIVDKALGELKGLARVDETFRRTVGQGIAAKTVAELEQAVRTTAQGAGPDVFNALMEGRAATVNKFKTIDLLDKLRTDPEGIFNQLTKPAGLNELRELARIAPDEVRQVGRAWLDDAMTMAKAEGGFSREQGLLRKWQNLRPEVKRLIFADPAHVKDLDNFFLLAKKLAENPNPSGSALTWYKGAELSKLGQEIVMLAPGLGTAYTLTAPVVAKLLLDPRATRLLLQGLRLPVNAKAARVAWAGQLGRLLEAQHLGAPIPAGGEGDAPKVQPTPASGTAPVPPGR